MFAFMNLYEAEQYEKDQISGNYDPGESFNIALMVVEEASGFSIKERKLQKDRKLDSDQVEKIRNMVQRLKKNEPIQYIINKAWFYNMELYVDPHVLIPRPETEELVDWIIKDVKRTGKRVFERGMAEADETNQLRIVDIGTGSGCIALALKRTMPLAEVWGCDISDEVLTVARRNGSSLDIRVDFQAINFLDESQQKQLPLVNIVVSNPPYVPLNNKQDMAPHVLDHEPHLALFVPDNEQLVFYEALAHFGSKHLQPGGLIYLEIHESCGRDVVNLLTRSGYRNIELRKDMQGKERMVKAEMELNCKC